MGGNWPVQIVSIRNTQTHQNFGIYLGALYWLDVLFGSGGSSTDGNPFSEEIVNMICELMDYAEFDEAPSSRFPQYILDIFDHWRFEKKRVRIKACSFSEQYYHIPSDLIDIFFHSLSNGAHPDDKNPRCNLLTKRVLAIFPELEYLIVDAIGYPFSLPLFINETLMGLHWPKNENFQCDVQGYWVSSECEQLSGDFTPFVLEMDEDEHHREYLIIQCA